jgi:hypothetical protein
VHHKESTVLGTLLFEMVKIRIRIRIKRVWIRNTGASTDSAIYCSEDNILALLCILHLKAWKSEFLLVGKELTMST